METLRHITQCTAVEKGEVWGRHRKWCCWVFLGREGGSVMTKKKKEEEEWEVEGEIVGKRRRRAFFQPRGSDRYWCSVPPPARPHTWTWTHTWTNAWKKGSLVTSMSLNLKWAGKAQRCQPMKGRTLRIFRADIPYHSLKYQQALSVPENYFILMMADKGGGQ